MGRRKSENKRQIGTAYEQLAAAYLMEQGYEIVTLNYRIRTGEIDIVAKDGEYLCFVEVKYRSDDRAGSGLCPVNIRKQRTIIRVAQYYMMQHGLDEWTPCRFDVVSIDGEEITLIQNAFQLC